MIVGVPREIKTAENRVALVPAGVESLVGDGHTVLVEQGAGLGSGFPDDAYRAAGATLVPRPGDVWSKADMVVKVKEPIEPEWPCMRKGQVVFTYFHFAASEPLTKAVLTSGITAIAYETVQLTSGELPLLTPMSEVAGRMAVQEGAKYLEKVYGGSGILLGGVPGVLPAEVLILGGGVVGANAAKMAAGLGAHVTLLDLSLDRLRYLADVLPPNVDLLYSNRHNLLDQLRKADVVIGAVLLPGAKAPRLVRRDDLKLMKPGSVIVDVAVDQGGCIETSKPTTHDHPTYIVDGHHSLRRGQHAGRPATHLHPGAHQCYVPLREAAGAPRLEAGVPRRRSAVPGLERGRGEGGLSRRGGSVRAAAHGPQDIGRLTATRR